MKLRWGLAAFLLATAATPAAAGAPFLTDDPAPTALAGWEIYAFTALDGDGPDFDDESGLDLNYGAFKDFQLTATLPFSASRDADRHARYGTGDVELAFKYRLVNDQRSGISVAVAPRAFLPTSSIDHVEKTRLLLPVWAEKDFAGGTRLFGGGGYEINPGPGNRGFWQAGAAVTHEIGERLTIGAELTHQTSDSVGAPAETAAGAGAIVKLSKHYSVLLSGGPTWAGRQTRYHLYASLGLYF